MLDGWMIWGYVDSADIERYRAYTTPERKFTIKYRKRMKTIIVDNEKCEN